MLSGIMLSVIVFSIMLSVLVQSVVMLSIVAPFHPCLISKSKVRADPSGALMVRQLI
jgi:hypothetical protein